MLMGICDRDTFWKSWKVAFWWALQLAPVLEILCWVGAESPSADINQIQIRSVLFLKSKIKKKKNTGKRTNQSKITTTLSSLCELTVPIWGPRRTMGTVKSRFLFSNGCQKQDEPGALRVQTSPLAETRVSCRPPHGGLFEERTSLCPAEERLSAVHRHRSYRPGSRAKTAVLPYPLSPSPPSDIQQQTITETQPAWEKTQSWILYI